MPTADPIGFPPGSVVVVSLPYADRLSEKRRPAFVVAGPRLEEAGFVRITMITSARNPAMTDDPPILDLRPIGLAVPSVVRPIKLARVEPARIPRRIGALSPHEDEVVFESVWVRIGPPIPPR